MVEAQVASLLEHGEVGMKKQSETMMKVGQYPVITVRRHSQKFGHLSLSLGQHKMPNP
jgi:hypothetical protein